MPLYEYECRQCSRRIEKIQKFSDPELTVCPHCGGALERTVTAAAVSFKGGGWYKDGYASAKPASSGNSEGASGTSGSGDSGSGSGASSDSSSSAPASSGSSAASNSSGSGSTASSAASSSSSSSPSTGTKAGS